MSEDSTDNNTPPADKDNDEISDWIRENMVADRPSVLEEERDRAAEFFQVSTDGTVIVNLEENGYTSQDQIVAYCAGKHYAAKADFCEDTIVSNQELAEALRMPDGTVKSGLKSLRDDGIVESDSPGNHRLPLRNFKKALDRVESA